MFEKNLLAVDGSEHVWCFAKKARDLARAMKSKILCIVVAFDSIPPYWGEPNIQPAIDTRMKEADAILQKAQDAVGKIPGEIHTKLIEGSPVEAIINVAKTRGSTVIVMAHAD